MLNYRDHATPHMDKLDEGIGYYLRSVNFDPHYAQVREYFGETYVIKGDLASAKYHRRVIHRATYSFTSIAARSPSLNRLKQIEVMKIIAPGNVALTGLV